MPNRRAGLGTVATRTRGAAREDAGRIQAEPDTESTAHELAGDTPPPAVAPVAPPAGNEGDSAARPEQQNAPAEAPVSTRGRKRKLPSSLTPSRVSQRRVQIGPRLRPAIHSDFDGYTRALAPLGFTQSDLVESAIVEYMERYPVEAVRAALLELEDQ